MPRPAGRPPLLTLGHKFPSSLPFFGAAVLEPKDRVAIEEGPYNPFLNQLNFPSGRCPLLSSLDGPPALG